LQKPVMIGREVFIDDSDRRELTTTMS
jgi:hypothetical protein